MDAEIDKQKARILAFLLLDEKKGIRCTPEDLSNACLSFKVTPAEIRRFCKLPNVPLRLLDDDRLAVEFKSFHILSFSALLELSHNQGNNFGTGPANLVVDPPTSKKDTDVVANPRSTCEPILGRSDFNGLNAIKREPAVTEIRTQEGERSIVLLSTGNRLATNGCIGSNHKESCSNPPQRAESYDENFCKPLERAERVHLATTQVENDNNAVQGTEKTPLATTQAEDDNNAPQGTVKTPLATTQVQNDNNALQGIEKTPLATTQVEHDNNALQGTEKTPPATATSCLVELGLVPLVNEINAQPKKKSRDSRSVPRFEEYEVDGEVGAGGYGTVYKVLRHSDRQVFAMKCPLENTHDSNVRNEINMLKRLRGKDYIIQFQKEVIGKVSPKLAGGGEEVNCPSILLEFIEHDKPEILKKEITVDELKCYSFSLFKALAQLHKERILHLDVKPGNFLFSRSTKRGCLVDFNLARDESAKRLSTRRPRGSSRVGTAEAKNFERTKCLKRTLVHDDTTLTCVKPSKRGRQICHGAKVEYPAPKDGQVASPKYQQLPQSRTNSATGAITPSIKHSGPLKINENPDNTGNAQQLEAPKTQQTLLRGLAGRNHRIASIYVKENIIPMHNFPTPPSTKAKGVPALKPHPNKRMIHAVVPPLRLGQPPSAKRLKPALKAPCHQVKDGPCVGTRGFRAPEVLMRSTRQTTKVDIWSAGVSLLQLVTGRSPFPSTTTEGALKDIAKVRGSVAIDNLAKSVGQRRRFSKDHPYLGVSVKEWSDRHSRRTELKGKIPPTLYDLLEKCLDVNPDSRITAEAALLHQFCSIEETSEF